MKLTEQIYEDMKSAMKAKETLRLEVLRSVRAAFTNELVATKRTPQNELDDDEAVAVIKKLAKQRQDSLEQYEEAGRDELASKEERELAILDEYLPEMMSTEEIKKIAVNKKDALGVTDKSKMGILIGAVMKETQGHADGKDVKAVVEKILE